MEKFVTISGCSGGGKSTLLAELQRRGHTIVEEPGRRIVVQELQGGGRTLPWVDATAFARRAIEMSVADRAAADGSSSWVFFRQGCDRRCRRASTFDGRASRADRYNSRVFLTPPWPEIFVTDQERRHSLAEAIAEYDGLMEVYPSLGYEVCVLPKVSVEDRADFVLAALTAR
jgi:predicted ATPase